MNLRYLKHSLLFVSAVTGSVSISVFASLVGAPVLIISSVVGLKTYATTAGIQKYNSIINKKKKKHDKLVLLGIAKPDITVTFSFVRF